MKRIGYGFFALAGMVALAQEGGAAVIISGHATKNMSCTGGVCQPTAASAWLNVTDLTSMLGRENVTVQGNAVAPDIMSSTGFSWNSSYGLTLAAAGNLTINRLITDSAFGPASLMYNENGTGGVLSFGPKGRLTFSNTSTNLSINGQAYVLVSSIATLARLIADNPSGDFALAGNYNARGDGTYAQSPITTVFTGNFEGLGNSISHLKVESSSQAPTGGLFEEIAPAAFIGNVILNAVTLQTDGTTMVGGLVAENLGTLSQDSFSGNISTSFGSGGCYIEIGGLAGLNDGTITYSHAGGTITATTSGLACFLVGGLVGLDGENAVPEIDHSYATDSINVSGSGITGAGGLVGGAQFGSILQTFATGAVTSSGATSALLGGLIGVIGGATGSTTVSNSSASGAVSGGDGSDIGGAIGQSNSTASIDSTVATGGVSGGQNCNCGGGLGLAAGPITNTVSYGTVTGGSGSFIGGFLGYDQTSGGLFSNDGWDMTTSGINNSSQGAGNIPNDPGITGFN